MPRLEWTRRARLDLVRLDAFLASKSADAASRAMSTIRKSLKILTKHPEIGRPIPELSGEFREWIIDFGQAGYVALYRYDGRRLTILAIRHRREDGY